MEISVGQVSGAINLAILIGQITYPLILVFVLVGVLRESNTATTWSVVCRIVQSTWWPSLLSSDSATYNAVGHPVVALSVFSTVGMAILAIASIITPLGLSDEIVVASVRNAQFNYIRDPGPYGLGTPTRDDYTFSRICGIWDAAPCPSQPWPEGVITNWTGTTMPSSDYILNVSTAIPKNLTDLFRSFTDSNRTTTISGVFDIQYRTYRKSSDQSTREISTTIDGGNHYTIGLYRTYDMVINRDPYVLIDGLVVDGANGGIGFRNHTIPRGLLHGATWEEDLLWIKPDTVCVDSNLTVEYTLTSDKYNGDSKWSEVTLIDKGGLRNLIEEFHFLDSNDTQMRPELFNRGWRAASYNNFNLMRILNLTQNDTVKDIPLSINVTNLSDSLRSMDPNQPVLMLFSAYTLLPGLRDDQYNFSDISTELNRTMEMALLSRGYGAYNFSDFNVIHISVGLFRGAGNPLNGSVAAISRVEEKTKWSHGFYACASALKASIQRVTFSVNGTRFSDIKVISATPVPSSERSPLWAVETTGLPIDYAVPLWGVVDDRYENNADIPISTLRRPYLYLPPSSTSQSRDITYPSEDSIVGSTAPQAVLSTVYNNVLMESSSLQMKGYTGEQSFTMYSKWKNLSRSVETAPKIIDLIWTDLMANYVTGSKSVISSSGTGGQDPTSRSRLVRAYERQIRYNFRYAIPAIIFLTLWLFAIIFLLCLVFLKKSKFADVRQLVNHTATGRAVTTTAYPDMCEGRVSTKEWVRTAGKETIIVKYKTDGKNLESPESVLLIEEGKDEKTSTTRIPSAKTW